MLTDLLPILLRDIDTLTREIDLYPNDEAVWVLVPGQPNSGGTLVLHLAGNLRHFIGATLGHSGFVRDRDAEFTTKGLSRRELMALVETTRAEVIHTIENLPASVLTAAFPLQLAGFSFTTSRFLLHVATHLSYHLGQIDYHRRAVTGDKASAGAMPLAPIASAAAGTS